ncbi:hypothetical protein PC110_g12088 [Phytophthora cactorum]|uniref:Uncharacterized protein n=1 Tax=Phytophthora cactorum TaxID=29920 RepID=A0A329S7S9_9STRA|nr:hypothetical protein PC110_g12088 [Phytophthora cactorum]
MVVAALVNEAVSMMGVGVTALVSAIVLWCSGISKICEIARSNFQQCPDTD